MGKDKIGLIIQARVGSTRLPNKVVLPFFETDTILDIIIKKLLYLKEKDITIVLSTGSNYENDILKEYAIKYEIDFFQGSEKNVLDRFIKTSEAFNFSHIIRVCSDNPFLDVDFLNKLLLVYNKNNRYDYYSYKDCLGTPVIRTHLGLFAEIVSLKSLKIEEEKEKNIEITEHVTKYIYENPDKFRINLKKIPESLNDKNFLRFTIDDKIDFDNLKDIYSFYRKFNLTETIKFIESNANIKNQMLLNINKYSK